MTTHDPLPVIETIRNHLSVHDRRLTFLFGAGTSSAVNVAVPPAAGKSPDHDPLIPGIQLLTKRCGAAVSALGHQHAEAWEALEQQCRDDSQRVTVEQMLSRVRMKIRAVGKGESLVGLTREELLCTEHTICATIAKEVNPPAERVPSSLPHDKFASWIKNINRSKPLELFTTNYDILIEQALETARVPVFDGFVGVHQPFFYPESLEDEALLPNSAWLRLWKLHGSVNWTKQTVGGNVRIIRDRLGDAGEMILPSHDKYDDARKQPYMAYVDRLSRVMNSEHALVVSLGYSYGDDHINAILFGALEQRSGANVIALMCEDLSTIDPLVEVAMRLRNLTAIGRNGGVIGGVWGEWRLSKPVDERTHAFMDIAFDSNAQPESQGASGAPAESLEGKMRLGDFHWFCPFLNAMDTAGR